MDEGGANSSGAPFAKTPLQGSPLLMQLLLLIIGRSSHEQSIILIHASMMSLFELFMAELLQKYNRISWEWVYIFPQDVV